jgi:hypothetical protein
MWKGINTKPEIPERRWSLSLQVIPRTGGACRKLRIAATDGGTNKSDPHYGLDPTKLAAYAIPLSRFAS